MPARGKTEVPVDVTTRFERFPVSIRGAFVVRGADGNPHAVRFVDGRVERVPEGSGHPFAVEERLLDVAPSRDLFVPFEAPITDLDSGWYVIASSVEVDGGKRWSFSSRPFTIPWPRPDVRRGTIAVGRTVRAGDALVRLHRIEFGTDSAAVVWELEGGDRTPHRPGQPRLRVGLEADGAPLDVLPPEVLARSERALLPAGGATERRTTTYPVLRGTARLAVVVRALAGSESARVQVQLP